MLQHHCDVTRICAILQLERKTQLHQQGTDDLDARTREYEDAKNALAGHHQAHEHHSGCAACPSSHQPRKCTRCAWRCSASFACRAMHVLLTTSNITRQIPG